MIDLRKNKTTVNQLVSEGVITLDEVLAFAQEYMDAMDAFNVEEDRMNKEMSLGELIEMYKEELEKPSVNDEHVIRPNNPEYIIASTNYNYKETMVFYSNENGDIVSLDDYGGLTERYGSEDWDSHSATIHSLFGLSSYNLVWEKRISLDGPHHALYKRTFEI